MRVSPVGLSFQTLEEVLKEARASAEVTHNHPEGIREAQATAVATFLARQGESKKRIRTAIEKQFGYDLSRTTELIRQTYSFNESCQGTVPEAITAFLESEDYEDAVRLAISLGGDADTLACITGGIAGAFYGRIPANIATLRVGAPRRQTAWNRNTILRPSRN
jgi:ADP-ribosylglycohydrolase